MEVENKSILSPNNVDIFTKGGRCHFKYTPDKKLILASKLSDYSHDLKFPRTFPEY